MPSFLFAAAMAVAFLFAAPSLGRSAAGVIETINFIDPLTCAMDSPGVCTHQMMLDHRHALQASLAAM
jgi:hypothetical protein